MAAMGDAAQTGKALNAIHKPRTEWSVILCMLILSALSPILTRTMIGYGNMSYLNSEFEQIVIPMILSICMGAGIYFLNYSFLIRLRYVFFGTALLYAVCYWIIYDPFIHYRKLSG